MEDRSSRPFNWPTGSMMEASAVQESPPRVFPFFVGSGRSGTTLLQSIFDSHSRLAVAHESHFLVPMARRRWWYEWRGVFRSDRFLSDLYDDAKFRRLHLDRERVREAVEAQRSFVDACRAVFSVYAQQQGKRNYGDKTPHFVKHIDMLSELFPEARFVHVIRDGRNAALGFLERDFGPSGIVDAALYWKRNVDRGRRMGVRLGPDRYIEVRYEHLVRETESVVRTVCSFLDLAFEGEMLLYYERADEVLAGHTNPGIHENLRRPPTPGIRDWRADMSPRDAALFNAAAGETLRRVGYAVDEKSSAAVRLEAIGRRIGWEGRRISAALKAARAYVSAILGPRLRA